MTPENWKEYKNWLNTFPNDTKISRPVLLDKMKEIERRDLMERVVKILKGTKYEALVAAKKQGYSYMVEWWYVTSRVANALETGDTSEIEKWVKE